MSLQLPTEPVDQPTSPSPEKTAIALVRYGAVPEVAKCRVTHEDELCRGTQVVVQTGRGLQLGIILDVVKRKHEPRPAHLAHLPVPEETYSFEVQRLATADDLQQGETLKQQLAEEFPHWEKRISEWELDIQLVELECTLDGNRILYVLNERGPDCTKLALRAAAAGLGIISVQPVSAQGLVSLPASAGVGSGGCGSSGGSCGCH